MACPGAHRRPAQSWEKHTGPSTPDWRHAPLYHTVVMVWATSQPADLRRSLQTFQAEQPSTAHVSGESPKNKIIIDKFPFKAWVVSGKHNPNYYIHTTCRARNSKKLNNPKGEDEKRRVKSPDTWRDKLPPLFLTPAKALQEFVSFSPSKLMYGEIKLEFNSPEM